MSQLWWGGVRIYFSLPAAFSAEHELLSPLVISLDFQHVSKIPEEQPPGVLSSAAPVSWTLFCCSVSVLQAKWQWVELPNFHLTLNFFIEVLFFFSSVTFGFTLLLGFSYWNFPSHSFFMSEEEELNCQRTLYCVFMCNVTFHVDLWLAFFNFILRPLNRWVEFLGTLVSFWFAIYHTQQLLGWSKKKLVIFFIQIWRLCCWERGWAVLVKRNGEVLYKSQTKQVWDLLLSVNLILPTLETHCTGVVLKN